MASKRSDESSKHLTLYPDMPSEEIKLQADQHRKLDGSEVVMRSRCFLDFGYQDDEMTLNINITEDIEYHIVHSIHLPRLRGNPNVLTN